MVFPSGALLKRELLVQMRTVRSLLCFLALAFVAVWIVALNWPSRQNMVWSMIPFASSQIFVFLTFLLMIGAALFIPGIAATAIQGEKERRNWDMLSITLIRPWGIVFGKLFCIVGWYVILVAAFAPVVSVVFFLIGLDRYQVFTALSLLILTSVTLASLGLACSARFRSTPACVIASYGCMVLVMGVLMFPVLIVFEYLEIYGHEWWIFALSPLAMMGQALFGPVTIDAVLVHLAYQSLFAFAGLWSAAKLMKRKDAIAAPAPTEGTRRLPWVSLRRFSARGPINDWSNPILVRETRWGGLTTRAPRSVLFVGAVAIFFLMSVAGLTFGLVPQGYEWTQTVVLEIFLSGVTMCAVLPAMTANLFTKERDSGNMDLVRMTLMTPAQIVRGKFLAGLRLVFFTWIAFLIGSLLIVAGMWSEHSLQAIEAREAWLRGAITIFVAGTFAVVVAITVSIVVKRTLTAIMVTQFLNGMVFVGLFFFFGFALDAADNSDSYASLVWFSSPGTAFVGTLTGGQRPLAIFYWLLNLATYALVSWLLYRWAGWFFAKHRMHER